MNRWQMVQMDQSIDSPGPHALRQVLAAVWAVQKRKKKQSTKSVISPRPLPQCQSYHSLPNPTSQPTSPKPARQSNYRRSSSSSSQIDSNRHRHLHPVLSRRRSIEASKSPSLDTVSVMNYPTATERGRETKSEWRSLMGGEKKRKEKKRKEKKRKSRLVRRRKYINLPMRKKGGKVGREREIVLGVN